MREIKFRSWDTVRKVMNTGGRYIPNSAGRLETSLGALMMRVTGLKDTTGREIYEGDIVQEPFGSKWEVDVRDLESGVVLVKSTTAMASISFVETDFSLSECEIVGNIYENPELLPTMEEFNSR